MSGLVGRLGMQGIKYGQQTSAEMPGAIPLRDQLAYRRERAIEEVKRCERALQLLETNKDVEELINLLGGY